jgi:ATP-dependent RNA helicase DeaD
LANRYQHNPLGVSGESAERGHADIEHVAYLLHPRERYDALLNVLLMAPEERTLVFVRTRADASSVASQLAGDGFKASALSGDLAQAERTRTLEAFRRGQIHVLVCTDVASRGIDVPDVTRVIHADLPEAPEALTHRSGRTGRAGNKGVSIMLVPTSAVGYAQRLLRALNITAELRAAPNHKQVQSARDARLFRELTEAQADAEGHDKLGAELLETLGAEQAVALLLGIVRRQGPSQPRELTPVSLNRPRPPVRTPFHKPQAPARRGFARPRRHA